MSDQYKQNHIREEAWLLKEKYGNVRTAAFEADRERLHRGEPLAYVIGWIPFLHTTIWLDSYPLIPRPETEFWTEKALAEIATHIGPTTIGILDLCAGSGAIGIAALHALPPSVHVDFAEQEAQHHDTIRKNILENGIDERRARIYGGDLFSEIPKHTTYAAILTNPPYIDPTHDRSDDAVRAHEPHHALYGGRLGTEIIERIIAALSMYLAIDGVCYIEHEPEHVGRIADAAVGHGYTATAYNDQYGNARYSVLRRAET